VTIGDGSTLGEGDGAGLGLWLGLGSGSGGEGGGVGAGLGLGLGSGSGEEGDRVGSDRLAPDLMSGVSASRASGVDDSSRAFAT